MSNHNMDKKQFKDTFQSLAMGTAMGAAARDYMKEQEEEKAMMNKQPAFDELDMDDLMDDPELQRLHEERIAKLREEVEKRQKLAQDGHGDYQEIEEADFLETVTKTERVVLHFYHSEFERCKIMDKHLKILCKQYFDTRFLKIHAPDCPFFVTKLQVQMLPCLVSFRNGVVCDKLAGFAELGGKDDFPTSKLEARLKKVGIVKPKVRTEDDSDDEPEEDQKSRSIFGFTKYGSDSEED
eukprot:CAMPEP_0182865820 /NCGR_PEP_ID=MMETSP0034_2-20130328/7885_1 /TAXON_ID=156128 /ORGANISM="Nephroselmis pyriformis, Strain CCMP717" /LENGTH=238 /DNA_ID=CAMNT_0024998139 /DNA_START=83 /DNA_END=799 /DNA_ORIENTATION=+